MARISKEEQVRVRRRLLASAARSFAEHGLEGANINEISTGAGYARGTVYNYFDSKEQLFAEVLASGSEETVRRYQQREVDSNVRARLLALTEEDVALVRKYQAPMKMIARELLAVRSSTRGLIEDAIRPLAELAADVIEEGQRVGEVRSRLPADRLARAYLGQLTMVYVEHWRSRDGWPSWDEMPELVVSLFLDGVGSTARASSGP